MIKKWEYIEKSLACFQLLMAALGLLAVYSYFYFWVLMGLDREWFTWEEVSISKLFFHVHLRFFIPLLSLFAGVNLWLGRKIGWLTALMATVSLALYLGFRLFKVEKVDFRLLVGLAFIELLCVSSLMLLVRPFFLDKYVSGHKTWWVLMAGIGLLVGDQLIALLN